MEQHGRDRFAWLAAAPTLVWLIMWFRGTAPDVRWLRHEAGEWGVLAPTAIFIAHILVHELGHAIGALLVDFRVNEIRVSKLAFSTTRRGTWFVFDLRKEVPWTGGWVMATTHDATRLPSRIAVYVGAGPAASLLFGATAGWWMWTSPQLPALATYGALLGFSTLAWLKGWKGPGYLTDFQTLRGAIRREPELLRRYRSMAINEALWDGVPLAATNLTREELDDLVAWDSTCWARVHACLWAIQANDFEAARAYAAGRGHVPPPVALLPGGPGALRDTFAHHALAELEVACLAKLGRRDEARTRVDALRVATAELQGDSDGMADIEAAVLLSEGKTAAAREAWERWEKRRETRPPEQAPFHRAMTGWIGTWLDDATKVAAAYGLPEVPRP